LGAAEGESVGDGLVAGVVVRRDLGGRQGVGGDGDVGDRAVERGVPRAGQALASAVDAAHARRDRSGADRRGTRLASRAVLA
jgi:hypothetical protein